MQVKWRVFKENFETEKCVAVMQKVSDDTCILTVYEEKKFHVAIPSKEFSFLSTFFVHRMEEWEHATISCGKDSPQFDEKCLEFACIKFEKDFNDQVNKILTLLL